MRKPSNLSSKTQPGSSKGAWVSVASIGCRRLGKVDVRLIRDRSFGALRSVANGTGTCHVPPAVAPDQALFSESRQVARTAKTLKTYQTSLGFFDQAIAAPSMKAALEAWGADSKSFPSGRGEAERRCGRDCRDHGQARRSPEETPSGRRDRSASIPGLPTELGCGGKPSGTACKAPARKPAKSAGRPVDSAAERKAAVADERGEKRRERDRAKAEAAAQREREHRREAIDKARAAFDAAEGEHAGRTAATKAERKAG